MLIISAHCVYSGSQNVRMSTLQRLFLILQKKKTFDIKVAKAKDSMYVE